VNATASWQRPRDPLIAAALAAFVGALLVPLLDRALIVNDRGYYLLPALGLTRGELPYVDYWVFYAPLRYHLLAWIFEWTGPSILAARVLWLAMILIGVAGTYRVARAFAPRALAAAPALAYGLVPGPWHKAPFALCTVAFLLAVVGLLAHPKRMRLAVLGAVAGLTLVTRQDLGLLQLALCLALAVARPWLAGESRVGGFRDLVAVGLPFLGVVAPVAAWYALRGGVGGLGDLVDAVFVRAFLQAEGRGSELLTLLTPGSLGLAPEGRGVGTLLLVALATYLVAALVVARTLRRSPRAPGAWLGAVVLAYGIPTLQQALQPPLLVRFLQSAIPWVLTATWLASAAAGALGRRPGRVARVGAVATTAGAWLGAAGLVAFVNLGVPEVQPSAA